jgi:hypothetical protein
MIMALANRKYPEETMQIGGAGEVDRRRNALTAATTAPTTMMSTVRPDPSEHGWMPQLVGRRPEPQEIVPMN